MSRKSVADEAKAVVRRNTAEVQGKGRFEVFEELFADDFVDHTTQPGTGVTPDKAGVRKLYASIREAFPDFHAEIHWQLADGDRVTTYKTYYGTHDGPFLGFAPTHRRIHFESVDVMRVQDGKITDHWGVGNLLSLMQQIGWTPPASVAASCDAEHERIAQERIAEDETAIRAASEGRSKAAQSKDLEKSLSFFADAAILLSPKSPPVQGKENIRKVRQQMLALPGPGSSFSAARVEVAHSGDVAWEAVTYEFTDKNANTTTEKGTYVTVWKKQLDGAWRVVGDIHNTNE